MKVLVTGAAGFIGFHLIRQLLDRGDEVIGFDNINDYYDVRLKYGRLALLGIDQESIKESQLTESSDGRSFSFFKGDLANRTDVDGVFDLGNFDRVVNLGAQAGVRYSLENPHAYVESNIFGFLNILEASKRHKIEHLVYASSSSVYGLNEKMPFSVHDNVDHPISLYASSKKSNELMAHTYSHLYGLPTTGLRFFTVYGPWGRPDMALFLFTKAILAGEEIKVFNNGKMKRDFTYVGDIVEGIKRVLDNPPAGNPEWSGMNPDTASSRSPYKIYNIGNNSPVELMDFIGAVEKKLGIEAKKNFLPIQPGDVPATFADVSDLQNDLGYKPNTSIEEGINNFVDWYLEFYGEKN